MNIIKVKFIHMILIAVLSVSSVMCMSSCAGQNGSEPMDVYIFSDISECDNFEGYLKCINYGDAKQDRYLKDLIYENFYSGKFEYLDFEFEIFAYEFYDSSASKKYFENVTDRVSTTDTNFLAHGGISNHQMVVIDENKAYTVYTSSSDYKKVNDIIGKAFTKQLFP